MEAEHRHPGGGDFSRWSPSDALPAFGADEVRFSRGFLRADFSRFFPSFAVHWKPLLLSLFTDFEEPRARSLLEFSENLERVIPIEIDGEVCVMGWDARTRAAILETVAAGTDGVAADLVLEYLERRLLSTLALSWCDPGEVKVSYLPASAADSVEVIGSVVVSFRLGGQLCECWIGLGLRLIDKFDLRWRQLVREEYQQNNEERSDENVSLSVELAELAVHPAMLIDYLRAGTVVDLETPVSDRVLVRVNGEPWGEGQLGQFNGRFAVRMENFDMPGQREVPENTTRVQIQIGATSIDRDALKENAQVGAVLLTRTAVHPSVSLTISGESVANAIVGRIGENFALHIAPS